MGAGEGRAPRLLVEGPGGSRREADMSAAVFTMGRADDCSLPLPGAYVSRVHARIEHTNDGYVITDAGSRNGTQVNGRPLSGEQLLSPGDEITIGEYRIVFAPNLLSGSELTLSLPRSKDAAIQCDAAARTVSINGELRRIPLSNQEFDLLALLATRYGRVCTRDELGIAIWGKGNFEYNMLHRLVHRLKTKLDPHAPGAVIAVPGIGYMLDIEGGDAAATEGRTGDALLGVIEQAHGTAVIMFTDVADSTPLTERLGDLVFRERTGALHDAIRASVRKHGGTPVEGKLLGDGVLALFPSARGAIDAALEAKHAGDAAGLPLHVGLHAGDVLVGGNDISGGAVNIAARVCSAAAAGEVLVSHIVRGLARTSSNVSFDDRGDHALKGLSERVRLYAVVETAGKAPS